MRSTGFVIVLTLALVVTVVLVLRGDPVQHPEHDTAAPVPQLGLPAGSSGNASSPAATVDAAADEIAASRDCADLYELQMQALYDDGLTEERINDIIREARSTLGVSSQLELRLFAAQLADSPDDRIDIFRRTIDSGDVSPHFLWSAVNACLIYRERVPCPAEDWLKRLLDVDSENSEVWMRAAAFYYATDDLDRAKQALERASIAYEADNYWYEDVMSAKAGADAVGGFSERASYLMATGFAAAYPGPEQLYTDMCRDMSLKDPDWAYACAAYGERAGETATTIMARQIAKAIHANALVALGEPENGERIEALRAPAKTLSDREMLRYPDSIMLYMSALERGSESDAVEELLAENERRRRNPTPPECGDFRLD